MSIKKWPKAEKRIITVTIDESGDLTFLNVPENDIFMELGETITRRASHIMPQAFWPRLAFTAIRYFVHDDSRIAAWTRGWACLWRVDTSPVGGWVLTWGDVWDELDAWQHIFNAWEGTAVWSVREDAIRAEVKFLNKFFLEGK